MAVLPASELMLMILPAPAARIPGSTAFTIRTAPKKLVSSCALASSTLVSSAAPVIEYPALLTSTSRRPAVATTCATQERTDSSERTSSATMLTPCDCALSGLRAVPKTLNPRSASSRAVAWPMPDEAPVTRIVCDMEAPKGYAAHNAVWALIVPSAEAAARPIRQPLRAAAFAEPALQGTETQKPESCCSPAFSRSETGYAETSHVFTTSASPLAESTALK